MATAAPTALLERDDELGALQAALRETQAGRGRLVVVEGAPGIGKTRLLREARERAERAGLRVLSARAGELERDFPFAVVRQLFGAAADAIPALGSAPVEEASVDPSFATLDALYWLTSNLAEEAPLLLVVDDAQWADRPSLRFLAYLLPRLEDLPVLLLVATRPGDADVARLVADPVATVVRPGTLGADGVAELVRTTITAADDAFCAACREASGGNPFLLHELLLQLAADGATGAARDAPAVRDVVPATISRAVLVRLAGLAEPARALAAAAAVLGDGADLREAAALAGLERDAAAHAVDDLAAAGVLESGRPLRFAHPLIRTAVHHDLPAARRSAAHARAAVLLRDAGAEPERVALHLAATEPGDDPAVVATLRAAAHRALARAAPESAVAYARRALRERADGGARADLVRVLVTGALRAPDPTAFDDLGVDVVGAALDDPASAVDLAPELALWLYGGGRPRDGSRLLAGAARAASAAGEHERALALDAQRVASDQVRLPESRAQMAVHASHLRPGTPGERLYLAIEAYTSALTGESAAATAGLALRALDGGRIFLEQPDSPAPFGALWALVFADALDEADRALAVALDDARGRGSLFGTALGTGFRGRLAHVRGDVAGAEVDVRTGVALVDRFGDVRTLPTLLAWLLDALVERDEPGAAQRELAARGLGGAEFPPGPWLSDVLFQRGRVRLALGRTEEGLADVLEAGRRDTAGGRTNPAAMPWASTAAVALGTGAEAARLAADELERARRWGAAGTIGVALRGQGLVAGDEDLLRGAAAAAVGLERTRALADLGAFLRRANRRAEAREPLRAALEAARRGGALAVASAAGDELAATGEKVRPPEATGPGALTPSERRVAELAAAGRANREIAQALFLTVKTVETHLSSAYRKLGIPSRRELPAALGNATKP
jgi:DNA-binding CsgD family transcriptional regulator